MDMIQPNILFSYLSRSYLVLMSQNKNLWFCVKSSNIIKRPTILPEGILIAIFNNRKSDDYSCL